MKRVALFGGSFNPPHIGHLMGALYVRACLGDDEVWLVPTFHHPFGKETVAYEHRVAMCEAAARDHSAWLKVSRAESEVPATEGRTIDLLEYLIPRFADVRFRFVIGSDILSDLPKWKAWDRIQQLVDVTVLNRAGYPAPVGVTVGPPLAMVSSSELRREGMRSELVPLGALEYARKHGLWS